MGLAIVGVIANFLGVFGFYTTWEEEVAYSHYYYHSHSAANIWYYAFIISLFFAFLSLLGLLFAVINRQSKVGPIMIMIGSIYFIPLGLIGIFGGRKLMKPKQDSELEARRNALNNKPHQDNQINLNDSKNNDNNIVS